MNNMSEKLIRKTILQSQHFDRYGNLRPTLLLNELQGMGDKHAENLGCGRTYLTAHNIAWVVTHYLVDIVKMPFEGEIVDFITWPSVTDNLRAIRDFEIRDSESGELLVRATSQWVLIDLERRRPMRLNENLPVWPTNNERAWNRTFDKFPDCEPTETHIMKCRFDDVDVNQHINNAVYATWASESVGYKFRNEHVLRRFEVNYKKEISPDNPSVSVDVAIDGNVSHHRIRTDDVHHAYVICYWDNR